MSLDVLESAIGQQISEPAKVQRAATGIAAPADHLSLRVKRTSPTVAGFKIYVLDKGAVLNNQRTYVGTVYFGQHDPKGTVKPESFSVPLPEEVQKQFAKPGVATIVVESLPGPAAKLDNTQKLQIIGPKLVASSNASFQ